MFCTAVALPGRGRGNFRTEAFEIVLPVEKQQQFLGPPERHPEANDLREPTRERRGGQLVHVLQWIIEHQQIERLLHTAGAQQEQRDGKQIQLGGVEV
jgi:hypothetical protein